MLDFHESLGGWLAGCLVGWLGGWLASWLAGWLAGCQQCIWDTKMRQKRAPLARKCVENAHP